MTWIIVPNRQRYMLAFLVYQEWLKAFKEQSMSVEHHDLIHEFPDLKGRIHDLKLSDPHFRKLFDAYHDLTRNIEKMEDEVTPVATHIEEEHKVRRLRLKDELYRILTTAA